MLEQLIDSILSSFDFGYCLTVNILTYIVVRLIDSIRSKHLTKWQKRIVLLVAIAILSTAYYLIGTDLRVLVNSSILAPVSWSWVFKPIVKKLNLDYRKYDY